MNKISEKYFMVLTFKKTYEFQNRYFFFHFPAISIYLNFHLYAMSRKVLHCTSTILLKKKMKRCLVIGFKKTNHKKPSSFFSLSNIVFECFYLNNSKNIKN